MLSIESAGVRRLKNIGNIVISAVFVCCLLALSILFFAVEKRDFSDIENRELARFPAIWDGRAVNREFYAEFDRYYSDAFPLRDAFLQANRQIQMAYTALALPGDDDGIVFIATDGVGMGSIQADGGGGGSGGSGGGGSGGGGGGSGDGSGGGGGGADIVIGVGIGALDLDSDAFGAFDKDAFEEPDSESFDNSDEGEPQGPGAASDLVATTRAAEHTEPTASTAPTASTSSTVSTVSNESGAQHNGGDANGSTVTVAAATATAATTNGASAPGEMETSRKYSNNADATEPPSPGAEHQPGLPTQNSDQSMQPAEQATAQTTEQAAPQTEQATEPTAPTTAQTTEQTTTQTTVPTTAQPEQTQSAEQTTRQAVAAADTADAAAAADTADAAAAADTADAAAATAADARDDGYEANESTGVSIVHGQAFEVFVFSESRTIAYAEIVDAIAEQCGVPTYVVMPPSASEMFLPDNYRSLQNEQKPALNLLAATMKTAVLVDSYDAYMEEKDNYVYFRTDHHWTADGAFIAYREFARAAGFSPIYRFAMERGRLDGFLGSLYRQIYQDRHSVLLEQEPDYVRYYEPLFDVEVTNYRDETMREGIKGDVLKPDGDMGTNLYNVFFGGDMRLLYMRSAIANGRSIIVVRDSYGHAFLPFLANNYEHVYAIEPRYFDSFPLAAFIAEHNIGELVFLNHSLLATGRYWMSWISELEKLA